jgi:SulP family sulfate permease
VVIGGIAAATVWDLGAHGVKVLGEVPQGVPVPGLPRALDWSDLEAVRREMNALLPLALACFLLGAVESAAIGRMFAAKHGGRFDSNQEFLALAVANLASGLGRGYPVSGGMSQSLVNESAGARSPLSGLIAALIILVVIVYFSQLLASLPQPVLAAIVLMAVAGLFNVRALVELWRIQRAEFVIAAVALVGVLASGLLRGVLIGAIMSLVLLLRAGSRPHVAFLGRIPGTGRFSDLARHPENEAIPGVLIVRPESALLYFNVDHVRDTIMDRVRAEAVPLKLVILDVSSSPRVDLQSAHSLAAMGDELAAMGARLRILGAHAATRDALRALGLQDRFGHMGRSATVSDVIEEFLREAAQRKDERT